MQHNHNLIAKYLEIISEQEQMLKTLGASNTTLLKRNSELKNQSRIYKESAIEWKAKADSFESCLRDTYNAILEQNKNNLCVNTKRALDIYKANQG